MKIDRGVPIPKKYIEKRRTTYPIKDMKEGDSFAITLPDDREKKARLRNSLMGTLRYHKKKYGLRFVTRTVEENRKKKLRVWRVPAE